MAILCANDEILATITIVLQIIILAVYACTRMLTIDSK